MPKLSHNNKSIVFSTIKVICSYLSYLDPELSLAIQIKLRPPISKHIVLINIKKFPIFKKSKN